MREASDEKLMLSYAAGDMAAFELLYARQRGPLYRYILRQVGDAATANDLYQGSWEKIIKARQKYSPSAPFKAWMFRIAHNHVVDHFRRDRPSAELREEEVDNTERGPVEAASAEQRKRRLEAAILALPPEQKEALVLKLESGLDLQAIADVTGVNRETAKSRLRYATGKLKQTLGD
jgi:RNA polymerase sigma-70 factor (ECF subfamily)